MEEKETKTKVRLNKKIFIVLAIIIVIAVAVVIILTGKKSNEKELETTLSEMGKSFYENFYYEQIGSSGDEKIELLSKFTTVGIKIDLENLGRYNDGEFSKDIEKFVNSKTKGKCNKSNTKVIIYPTSPYGKTDYKIETELDCGFDSKK